MKPESRRTARGVTPREPREAEFKKDRVAPWPKATHGVKAGVKTVFWI